MRKIVLQIFKDIELIKQRSMPFFCVFADTCSSNFLPIAFLYYNYCNKVKKIVRRYFKGQQRKGNAGSTLYTLS